MKSYQLMLIVALLVASATAGYTNTTFFWQQKMKDNATNFQVYSGKYINY